MFQLSTFSAAAPSICRLIVTAYLVIGAVTGSMDAQQRDVDGELWKLQAPNAFGELPVSLRQSLEQQRCRIPQWIPQSRGVRPPHNVVTGEFQKLGQRDWAALCVRGSKATIMVFWAGSAARVEEVVVHAFTPGQWLGVAKPDYIRAHLGPAADPDPNTNDYDKPPAVIDHDGLEDGILCCSTIRYYHQGRWLRFPGAD
jgi:hypothetical protein